MIFDAGALLVYCATSEVSLYVQPFSGASAEAWLGVLSKFMSYAITKKASTLGASAPTLKSPPSQLAEPE